MKSDLLLFANSAIIEKMKSYKKIETYFRMEKYWKAYAEAERIKDMQLMSLFASLAKMHDMDFPSTPDELLEK